MHETEPGRWFIEAGHEQFGPFRSHDLAVAAVELAEAEADARRAESLIDPSWKRLDETRDALADEAEDNRRELVDAARADARWARRGDDL